jgi:exocyst complex component 7
MAVGLSGGRAAADEEARAEVDVLNSRLEKTTQLTKKIQACLGRLEETGKSVRDVAGPLNGETKKLQVLGNSEPPRSLVRGMQVQLANRTLLL